MPGTYSYPDGGEFNDDGSTMGSKSVKKPTQQKQGRFHEVDGI